METIALTEAVYYILLSLDQPMHGYGIMQNTEELSGGRVRLAPGTLYGALNSLLEKGWIEALPGSNSRRKKEYRITPAGRKIVQTEIRRLEELLRNGKETENPQNILGMGIRKGRRMAQRIRKKRLCPDRCRFLPI